MIVKDSVNVRPYPLLFVGVNVYVSAVWWMDGAPVKPPVLVLKVKPLGGGVCDKKADALGEHEPGTIELDVALTMDTTLGEKAHLCGLMG